MNVISPKRLSQILSEAEAVITQISVTDARNLLDDPDTLFVDLRDVREIERLGGIHGAHCCARGLLEFAMDPDSPYFREVFTQYKNYIFYCDNGLRSTLAAQLAMQFGLQNVLCLSGGLEAWLEAGRRLEPLRWTATAD
ncbi:rhodanese-like domain-containing protein [Pseudophaeobacter sp.]|jgi:rhodanese-related sulfurtransferase|uniref:rhodanese-like domain-containing protein n=1 Tax=Pseudophaeobacter sp. TaxID=1971739 RepID=UPI002606C3F3|nr:rhodanese-like domain-containing protein [Pseudophaeobacter sp.]